jgi:hypothetical protein
MTPIIIPINNTREVNCIVEQGVRYCEKKDFSKQEVAVVFLGLSIIILWLMFWGWLSFRVEDTVEPTIVFIIGGIVAPLIIIGTLFLF